MSTDDEDDSWLSFSSLWLAMAGQSDEWPDAMMKMTAGSLSRLFG